MQLLHRLSVGLQEQQHQVDSHKVRDYSARERLKVQQAVQDLRHCLAEMLLEQQERQEETRSLIILHQLIEALLHKSHYLEEQQDRHKVRINRHQAHLEHLRQMVDYLMRT